MVKIASTLVFRINPYYKTCTALTLTTIFFDLSVIKSLLTGSEHTFR